MSDLNDEEFLKETTQLKVYGSPMLAFVVRRLSKIMMDILRRLKQLEEFDEQFKE